MVDSGTWLWTCLRYVWIFWNMQAVIDVFRPMGLFLNPYIRSLIPLQPRVTSTNYSSLNYVNTRLSFVDSLYLWRESLIKNKPYLQYAQRRRNWCQRFGRSWPQHLVYLHGQMTRSRGNTLTEMASSGPGLVPHLSSTRHLPPGNTLWVEFIWISVWVFPLNFF